MEVPKDQLETIVRDRKTGRAIRFALTPAFLAQYLDLPTEKVVPAGREVVKLKDEQIFSMKK